MTQHFSSYVFFIFSSICLQFTTLFVINSLKCISFTHYPLLRYYFFSSAYIVHFFLPCPFRTTENELGSNSASFIKPRQIPTLQDLVYLRNSNNDGSSHLIDHIFSLTAYDFFSCELGIASKLNNNYGLVFLAYHLPHMHITGTILKTLNKHILIYLLTAYA